MSFTLDAWRVNGAEIQKLPLTVWRKVNDEEFATFQELITPHEVIQIKARVVVDSVSGFPQSLLEAYVGHNSSDVELNQIAEDLQKPVTLDDPLLGTLTLDRRVDCFSGEVIWDGKPISLTLSQSDNVQEALKTAYTLWQNQGDWNRRIRSFAVEKLLPLKNEAWLDEGEAEWTPHEFKERMTLESIAVNADGSFDFWHNEGDLFWGHSIEIRGNLIDGPTHADIPG